MSNLKLRGAMLTACAGVISTLVACGGDDTSTPTVFDGSAPDGSAPDSSMQGTPDAQSPEAASPEAATGTDAARPVDAASPVDAANPGDAANPVDAASPSDAANPGDATKPADAGRDAGTILAPLTLCPTLDTDWATSPTDYDTRSTTWADGISGPPGYATALGNDCRTHAILATVTDASAFLAQLNAWTLQFFGCGLPDAGALSFSGLIPAGAASHTFTVADLTVIASLFANAANAQASINWAANLPPNAPEPLTVDQIDAIQAQLSALAAVYPGVNPSTTHLTFSTCPTDAGTDASGD